MQTVLLFKASVVDTKWGDTLWEGNVEAIDAETAKAEAASEYRAYVKNAYEPGDYKAAMSIIEDVTVHVSRVVAI